MPRVILIGPPGSGKSTVGRALAKRLSVDWVDTDQMIEERTGKKYLKFLLKRVKRFFVNWKK